MKTVLFSILTLGSIAASAAPQSGSGSTFTVDRVSPAYVHATTYSLENPLSSPEQFRLAYGGSRTSAFSAVEDNLSAGYDLCAPLGRAVKTIAVGSTGCEKDNAHGGYRCETPFRVLCVRNS